MEKKVLAPRSSLSENAGILMAGSWERGMVNEYRTNAVELLFV